MFDSIGTFFQKIGAAIGTGLITLGSFFGAQPTEAPITQDSIQETSIEAGAEVSAPVNESKKSVTPSTATQGTTPKPEVVSTKTTLQIENIKSSVRESEAVVTWTTTLPAESRLMFDNGEGRVFESESGLSTGHKVYTTGLEESEEYDYKIVATTEDKKQNDDYFGTLYALKKYTALLGEREEDCQTIIIRDTAGNLAVGKKVSIRGYVYNDQGLLTASVRPTLALTSNSAGKVEYCGSANGYKVTGEELDITISAP